MSATCAAAAHALPSVAMYGTAAIAAPRASRAVAVAVSVIAIIAT